MLDQEFLSNFILQIKESLNVFKPEFALVITFIAALMFDMVFKKHRNTAAVVALLGFIVTGVLLSMQSCGSGQNAFTKMLTIDSFGNFFKWIILGSSIIVVIISLFSKELYEKKRGLGEYYSLIIGMTIGMFLLASSVNLLMIYISIEIMSLSSYVLAGYTKESRRSSEASLKYVIYGAISSGLMIYGVSLLYGLSGSLSLFEINTQVALGQMNPAAFTVAILMILAGIGYKISTVPFHFWTPDVYEGAPVTVTALLSVASKAAGFAVLIRFVRIGFSNLGVDPTAQIWQMLPGFDWTLVIAILSVLSMTVGNLVALWQSNVKRMLAYSSIAHAGYMLLGLVVLNTTGVTSILVYFFMYMFMNLGAFYFVLLIANKIGSEELDDYVGLGYSAPVLSICMVVFMISLTGLPPTAGFIGKWYVFTALLQNDHYVWLAVIGVLNSVVSLFYYAKVFRNMYLRGTDIKYERMTFSPVSVAIIILLAIPTLLFGVYFQPIVNWASHSAQIFFGI